MCDSTQATFNYDPANSVGLTLNANQINAGIQQSIPQQQTVTINVANPNYNGFASSSTAMSCQNYDNSLYHKVFNFGAYPPSPCTKCVANESYPKLFNSVVAEEVKYFLDRQKNSNPYWHEHYFNNLTVGKVAMSLNPNVLTYFNNIHGAGNAPIDSGTFYSVIKKHLVEGTIDEVDVDFYKRVFESQLRDPRIAFSETGQTPNALNLAFSIFEQNSLNPNYNLSSISQELRNEFMRMRFLAEDIGAYLEVMEIEGVLSNLFVTNAGIPVEQVTSISFVENNNPSSVSFGAGAGYYFSTVNLPTNSILPLPTLNNLSSAYYLQLRDRYNILNLLNADSSFKFSVYSQSGVHEFSSSYNPSADLYPMYLALNLNSVADIPNPNSVITTTSAVFNVLSDEEAIEHSRSNGLNVIRLNVDYRDPFINYLKDVSTLNFEYNDFNLRSFGFSSTFSNKIMLRNLPQGIIVAPGRGSQHNPFNSKSELDTYDSVRVKRTLKANPSIDISNLVPSRPSLDSNRIYFELSSNSLGSYEEQYLPDVHGFVYTYNPSSEIFNYSYYIDGQYTYIQPPSSTRLNSPEGKFMELVNNLTLAASAADADFTNSGLPDFWGFVTWYDIFTRISSNEIGRLKYSNFEQFRDKLQTGYSNNIPVVFVFNNAIPPGAPNQQNLTNGVPESTESNAYYSGLGVTPPPPVVVPENLRWNDYYNIYRISLN